MALLFAVLTLTAPGDATAQRTTAELSEAPTFTPMTARPEILNAPEIERATRAAYPPMLRDAGVEGRVAVFFFIQEDGRVGNALISTSSGHTQLDQAALEVARVYQFKPAMNRDRAVPVWVVFPITFRVGDR
jgi:protein TonB